MLKWNYIITAGHTYMKIENIKEITKKAKKRGGGLLHTCKE